MSLKQLDLVLTLAGKHNLNFTGIKFQINKKKKKFNEQKETMYLKFKDFIINI